jgi:glucose/arabinose dehydrogenase
LVALALLAATMAHSVEVRFERVAESAYAFVGEIAARTPANEGLNANRGLVVTPAGALLIDSGGPRQRPAARAACRARPEGRRHGADAADTLDSRQ